MKCNKFGAIQSLTLILAIYVPVVVEGFVVNYPTSSRVKKVPSFQQRNYHYHYPGSNANTFTTTTRVRHSNADNCDDKQNDTLIKQKNEKIAQTLRIMSLSLCVCLSSSVMPVTAGEMKGSYENFDSSSLNAMKGIIPLKKNTGVENGNTVFFEPESELALTKSQGCEFLGLSTTMAADETIDETKANKKAVAEEGGKWFFIVYVVFSFAAGAVEMTKRFQTWLENRQ